jgi:hypothetical protein
MDGIVEIDTEESLHRSYESGSVGKGVQDVARPDKMRESTEHCEGDGPGRLKQVVSVECAMDRVGSAAMEIKPEVCDSAPSAQRGGSQDARGQLETRKSRTQPSAGVACRQHTEVVSVARFESLDSEQAANGVIDLLDGESEEPMELRELDENF